MGWAFWALGGVLLATAVLAITRAAMLGAEREHTRRDLDVLLAERDQLLARVAELTRELQSRQAVDGPDYVITRLGDSALTPEAAEERRLLSGRRVPDQLVLSTALGEPLVKVLSLGHGLRRALSPESRNRIGFAIRRETRRSRKVRRREMREAWKQMHAQRSEEVSTSVAAQPARPPGQSDSREDVA